MTILLVLVGGVADLVFWLGVAIGLLEVAGILAFWSPAFRLGRRTHKSTIPPMVRPPTPGQTGTTRFTAFRVGSDGTCLFRRKTGFLQTALEWKGVLRWKDEHAEVTAIEPLGPTIVAAALTVSWLAFGLSLLIQGDYTAGAMIVVIVVLAAVTGVHGVARTARIRFDRYVDEVTNALAAGPALAGSGQQVPHG